MCTRRHPPSQPSRHRPAPTCRVRLWTQRAAWAKYTAPFALRRAHQASAPAWPIIAHETAYSQWPHLHTTGRSWTWRLLSARARHAPPVTSAHPRWHMRAGVDSAPRVHTPSVCSSICSSTSVESSTNHRVHRVRPAPTSKTSATSPLAVAPKASNAATRRATTRTRQRERDSANATTRTRRVRVHLAHPSHSPSRPTIGSGRHRQWAPPIPLSRRRGHRRGRCMRRRAPRTWRA